MTNMITLLVILAGIGGMLIGCNTMEGVGKDVKGAGKSLEKSAKKNKPNPHALECR